MPPARIAFWCVAISVCSAPALSYAAPVNPAPLHQAVLQTAPATAVNAASTPINNLLATDTLSAGMPLGDSHVIVALSNPGAAVSFQRPAIIDNAVAHEGDVLQRGTASWYGRAWAGRRTASGSRYNPNALTAASRELPLGSRILVTLTGTARSVLVTITDRLGNPNRIIDLSRAAARKLGIVGQGTAQVILTRASFN